ncbi:hypothetical protein BJ138DRAFT_525140 [Hygrophoropsis aurantiaca]|uniref:Uncharacterized protein n=1 Tax=Hygrophoropsis aurantiaca TaxID=72124 RepID=A0ACB8A2I5_9AGAM|nr:hypothetical protein BJ138DRAFT_525140 [Hygrophoropsis aurantiaca]
MHRSIFTTLIFAFFLQFTLLLDVSLACDGDDVDVDNIGMGCSNMPQTWFVDMIGWSLSVHTGVYCGGEHSEGFHGHQATMLYMCSACFTLKPAVNQRAKSIVFSTVGGFYDVEYEQPAGMALRMFHDDDCQNKTLEQKGPVIINEAKSKAKVGSFQVCYLPSSTS